MKIYHQLTEVPKDFGPSIATIGNFDGVHRGHQWVIAEVVSRARQLGIPSIAITFDPHPARVLRPDSVRPMITPLAQKLELLEATGIDALLLLPFTTDLSRKTARSFATEVLQQTLHVTELHEGENFRFGYQAEADIESLEALGHELTSRSASTLRAAFAASPSPPAASAISSPKATSATPAPSSAALSPSLPPQPQDAATAPATPSPPSTSRPTTSYYPPTAFTSPR
jgi:hypothetical protein